MKYSQKDREEAVANLRETLNPGDTVYTILRHVSRSGMRREIGVLYQYTSRRAGSIRTRFYHPNYLVACILGESLNKNGDGIKVNGCGMDMGADLVYRLGAALWPDGTTKPHGTRNGRADRDGGYALKQEWL